MPEGFPESRKAEFDAMVEACVAAGEAVMEHGSERLQGLMKLFLLELGSEVARRVTRKTPKN